MYPLFKDLGHDGIKTALFTDVSPTLTRQPYNPYSAGTSESEICICLRQILTSKVDPRTVRSKLFVMVVDS